ncbi:carboxyl transferase domain-containing protein [Rhodococcus sp. USK13]|uniref:carboxyl transferase domain-containing protein n=1 Tax=Rhodococcus sp. USK13 TaxID=2806442 RepID=UPI001BCF1AEA|nr:carboxyl transferase domain-containing protein [Rhodococcus sp. USK13]
MTSSAIDNRSAYGLLTTVLDENSFNRWDVPVDLTGVPVSYQTTLRRTAVMTGMDESILTGMGRVHGRPVAIIVSEFQFLGGSIGRAAAERIVSAIRRASAEGLPVLAATASGGTRMQEGTPAFVKMVDITRAVMEHRAMGLPYLVYLRHPTTGGCFASWGSLGQLTVAEPGALIGFLGPKVFHALTGRSFPPGVQTAENLHKQGIIDALAGPEELSALVDRTLRVLSDPPSPSILNLRESRHLGDVAAWTSIQITRNAGRVDVRDVLRVATSEVVLLSGTGKGERSRSVLTALARIDGEPCVVVGHDRSRAVPLGPDALRESRRAMRLAQEWGLPLVTIIDTDGAELSPAAEEGALSAEIAECIAVLTALTVPTVSLLLGRGCGGGAIALLAGSTVIALEHAWLSPLPPEGASMITYGDPGRAVDIANDQHVRAADLLAQGIVHCVIPELPEDTVETLAGAAAAQVAHSIRLLRERSAASPST